MKRTKYVNQYNLAFILAVIALLFIANYLFTKVSQQQHYYQQQNLSQTIMANLTIELEYGLSFGNKVDLKNSLEALRNNQGLAMITVYDNQNNIMAQLDNRDLLSIPDEEELIYFTQPIEQSPSSSLSDSLLLNEEILQSVKLERRLGEVTLGMTPLEYSPTTDELQTYRALLNTSIVVLMVLLWGYMYYRLSYTSRVMKKMTESLNRSVLPRNILYNTKTQEAQALIKAIIDIFLQNKNFEHQLTLLKTEVAQARRDANTELQEFLGFLLEHPIEHDDETIQLFYQSITQHIGDRKSSIWSRDLLKQVITELSGLAKSENVTIYDTYSGDRINRQLIIDKDNFKRFLLLLVEQLIRVCAGHQLSISFDQRQAIKDNTILRISIESDADNFIQGITTQSLFHFSHEAPVSCYSNNVHLIAAKHLLRKFGGEYFYFEKEVRIEIPVATLATDEPEVWTESVSPIETDISALIFDSDPIDKMVLMGYLEKLGVNTEKASAKQVVLQKIRHEKFDVIMVNSDFLNEPDPFFFTNFASELNDQEEQTKILVISSDSSVQNTELFQSLNAHYLPKPIDIHQLKSTLINLCTDVNG
ncbi:response regulator receiver protein [Kangiella sp.]|uniref:response regulator receiver protein n=1 Tax=Kangiella sp. TaxID=1920245 RepID=UPI0019C1B898|nr:response regulator receiver protein [Kangiella sp.]MBD3653740.1 response regulator receiver protein [Kangiella sp.]